MARFENPDLHDPVGTGFWRWQRERLAAGLPKPPKEGYAEFARRWRVTPDFSLSGTGPTAWWLGHATVLLRIGGLHVITDPHLTLRASPLTFLGPRRHVLPPAAPAELPRVDVVLISHNHYDHLDHGSIRALLKRNPELVCYVPIGLAPWFHRRGVKHVHELGWWQNQGHQELEVHCVPAQHWSNRILIDRNKSLWCGWVLKTKSFSFYFSGDTGYSPRLAEIGMRLGEPDLAALPIGSYAPRWFMRTQHVDPPEAVQLHRELRVRHSLAIHWGTFELADDSLDEPVELLQRAMAEDGLNEKDFWIIRQGESRAVPPKP